MTCANVAPYMRLLSTSCHEVCGSSLAGALHQMVEGLTLEGLRTSQRLLKLGVAIPGLRKSATLLLNDFVAEQF
jgi:hypothetical protein